MEGRGFATDPFPLDRRLEAWREALAEAGLVADAEFSPPHGRLLRDGAPLGTELVLITAGLQRLRRSAEPASDRPWLGTLLEGTAKLPGGDVARAHDLLHWPSAPGPMLASVGRFRLMLLRLLWRDAR